MAIWLKRLFVVLVTIMTLGFYVPPIDLEPSNDSNAKEVGSEKKQEVDLVDILYDETSSFATYSDTHTITKEEQIALITDQAKVQTLEKLGPRIAGKIDRNFSTEILPSIEETIENVLSDLDQADVKYIEIVENTNPGYGEKIFDLYDMRDGKALAKFHVRRENRPLDGYWFNFHYHEQLDNYETHHTIGEVYWSKNTPPKWMS